MATGRTLVGAICFRLRGGRHSIDPVRVGAASSTNAGGAETGAGLKRAGASGSAVAIVYPGRLTVIEIGAMSDPFRDSNCSPEVIRIGGVRERER